MNDPTPPSLDAVLRELEQVKRRLSELEGATVQVKVRRVRARWVMAATLGMASVAFAQLTVFNADAPALAAEVNANFAQLKTWLEQKVGTVGTNNVAVGGTTTLTGATSALNTVRIQTGATSNAATAVGRSLLVTGNTVAEDGPIAEFRHDNLTQGVGIGFNTIYASGANADQVLQLKARGTSNINLLSPTRFSSTVSFAAARVVTEVGTNGGGPWGVAASPSYCGAGQYVCGVRLYTEPDQGSGDDSALNDINLMCCTLGN